ncbi:MAG: hypothetical protein ABEJ65_12945, partial [bacterium]
MGSTFVIITAAGQNNFSNRQIHRLKDSGDAEFISRQKELTPEKLSELLEGAQYAGLTPKSVPELDRTWIRQLPDSLEGISYFATGVDMIDLKGLSARGIRLANLPEYSSHS